MTHVLREAATDAIASCPNCGTGLAVDWAGARWTIRGPRDVADRLMLQLGSLEREELWVLVLNTKNYVMHTEQLYKGNVSSSLVRVGEVFREAIARHATGIIIAHNHPSGDPTPSPDDLHLTAEVVAAGTLLDIDVLDHVIVTRDTFVSLRDRGIDFTRR